MITDEGIRTVSEQYGINPVNFVITLLLGNSFLGVALPVSVFKCFSNDIFRETLITRILTKIWVWKILMERFILIVFEGNTHSLV